MVGAEAREVEEEAPVLLEAEGVKAFLGRRHLMGLNPGLFLRHCQALAGVLLRGY